MRRQNLFLIIITPKYNTQAFKNSENKHSKSQETGYEGHFSALYVIIEVPPLPPWKSPLPPSPPYLQPLPPPSSVQPLHPPRWYLFHDDDNDCHFPPPPYSESVEKEGSDGMSSREEVFVSHNSYESSAGCGIQSIGISKYISMGTGHTFGVFFNTMI